MTSERITGMPDSAVTHGSTAEEAAVDGGWVKGGYLPRRSHDKICTDTARFNCNPEAPHGGDSVGRFSLNGDKGGT